MSQTLKLPNYKSQNFVERGVLAEDHIAGDEVLQLENSNSFIAPFVAMIGKPVEERTEIVALGAITDDTHSVCDALKFAHRAGTEIYVLYGLQICVYRAANTDGRAPAVEAFSKVATVDIDADNALTIYTDNAVDDGADWWYRMTYKGPTGETNLADSPAIRGGNVGTYCTIDAIRDEAGLNNAQYVTDDLIAPHRDAAQAYVNGRLGGRYVVPFADPVNPWITDITKRLAAGYLMKVQWPSTPERGQEKIDKAVSDIDDIANGEMTLTDAVGVPTVVTGGGAGSYWPNEDTALTPGEQGGGERQFRVSDMQGYHERKY